MVNASFFEINDGQKLAFSQVIDRKNRKNLPGVVFLSGLKSDKEGTKAVFLSEWAERNDRDFLRFDYRGHGMSSGMFEDTSISDWLDDTKRIIMGLTSGPQILVGSSLGGWISLLFTRMFPEKVAGIIGIAAAPDFTVQYSRKNLTKEQRQELSSTGKLSFYSEYFDQPLVITKKLIEDGNDNLVLTKEQSIHCPVRLFHGSHDEDVPLSTSINILKKIRSNDMQLQIIKGIDHRFSTPDCLELIQKAVEKVPLT
ncbi:alpha/beta hydrolase [Paracoccaceae bacterium]|nr:alpha/beta hydrolase [Paracoccaceae bacterium]